jgi:AraC-like DNA-binding protein
MIIKIKDMVSHRCILKVKEELSNLGIDFLEVNLGEVRTSSIVEKEKINLLKEALLFSGLEIIEDKKAMMVEKVKACIVNYFKYDEQTPNRNFSDFVRDEMKLNYTYISNVFTERTGLSIARYLNLYRIEKAKELISYGEMNFSEIADHLGFSSISHFSNTFKKFNGNNPTAYKCGKRMRTKIEKLAQFANEVEIN